jgi:phosphohistidine phosphatase SixA
MKLYVMRHAPREPSDDFTEAEEGDPEAEITAEGRLIATAMGEWMVDNDEIPTCIYASDAVRTQQTAELVVQAIADKGFAAPEIKTDVGIGPYMSIRGLVLKLAGNDSKRVAIVSHQQSIKSGLRALNVDNDDSQKPDPHAAGEIRVLNVKRKTGKWAEECRVRPSDLGFDDVY